MKKLLSISLTMLLAIVITYAGSGINAYSFCCEDCHTYGIEVIKDNKCCDIHQKECSADQFGVNDMLSGESHNHCSLERLDIDLQNDFEKNLNELSAKILDISFITLLPYFNIIEEDIPFTGYVSQSQNPPNLSNHVYFLLLETLII